MSNEHEPKYLRVGQLAKAVGKSVRAVHLYEELGLLKPVARTSGGFRQFDDAAIERVVWINKLQAIGFSLTEIQAFVAEFERADSGRIATDQVRDVFDKKLRDIRVQLEQIRVVEKDLEDALAYLVACKDCSLELLPADCNGCPNQTGNRESVPELFAGLSQMAAEGAGSDSD